MKKSVNMFGPRKWCRVMVELPNACCCDAFIQAKEIYLNKIIHKKTTAKDVFNSLFLTVAIIKL